MSSCVSLYVGHDKAAIERRRVRIKIGHTGETRKRKKKKKERRKMPKRAGWLRRLPGEGQLFLELVTTGKDLNERTNVRPAISMQYTDDKWLNFDKKSRSYLNNRFRHRSRLPVGAARTAHTTHTRTRSYDDRMGPKRKHTGRWYWYASPSIKEGGEDDVWE